MTDQQPVPEVGQEAQTQAIKDRTAAIGHTAETTASQLLQHSGEQAAANYLHLIETTANFIPELSLAGEDLPDFINSLDQAIRDLMDGIVMGNPGDANTRQKKIAANQGNTVDQSGWKLSFGDALREAVTNYTGSVGRRESNVSTQNKLA